VGGAFATIETCFGSGQENTGSAEVDHGGFKAVSRAQGRLFEELHQHAAGEQLRTLAAFEELFEFKCPIKDGIEFVGSEIEQRCQVLHDPGTDDTG
ncbi:MAG: hypothetical protein RLZZ458_613, partial [Planctomycetota bacterium]